MSGAGELALAIVLMLIMILCISTASIGKECYIKNEAWAKDKPINNNYLTAGIVIPIVGFFIIGFMAYVRFRIHTSGSNSMNNIYPEEYREYEQL
jgi:hypothetical protein